MVKSGEGEDAEVNFKETMDQLNSKKLKAKDNKYVVKENTNDTCLLYTSPSPRDKRQSRMPSSA